MFKVVFVVSFASFSSVPWCWQLVLDMKLLLFLGFLTCSRVCMNKHNFHKVGRVSSASLCH